MEHRRIVFTEKETAQLEPMEIDESPLGPKEIAGPALATLISTGTELAGYTGADSYPHPTGYTAVFEVAKVGSDVTELSTGDKVFVMHGHGSWHRCGVDDAVLLPTGLNPQKAVFARMMAVSMSTLTTTTARPPERVVITGLGLVGHMAAKVFARAGYVVAACDPDSNRRKTAERSGIDTVLTEVPVDDPLWAGQVSLVVECSGHEGAVLDGCKIVRKRGEVVTVGAPWKKRADIQLHELHHLIFHNYVTLRSGWEWELPVKNAQEFRHNSILGNIAGAMRWLDREEISVDGLADIHQPADAQKAFQSLLNRTTDRLTCIFDWSDWT